MSSIIPQTGALPAEAAPSGLFAFSGAQKALAWLLLRNLVLTIVTLGIYHFWARTYVRAFFWRHLLLGGERFDYIGRGMELFIGAGLVFVLLAILFAFQNIWALWTSSQGFPLGMQFLLSLFSTAVFLSFVAYGRLLSWRYLMTRTLWRSVRFHMGEKITPLLPNYIGISLVLLLANVATLMLTYPYWRAWKIGFLMNHSFFGSMKAEFTGSPEQLLRAWLPVWLSIMGALACFAFFLFSLSSPQESIPLNAELGRMFADQFEAFNIFLGLAIFVFILGLTAYFFARYKGAELVFFLNHVRSGETRLVYDLPPRDFAIFLFKRIALVAVCCSVFLISLQTLPLAFIAYLILWKVLVILPMFAYVSDHLRVENYQSLENAFASGELSSFIGEGLAGGFDADVGF